MTNRLLLETGATQFARRLSADASARLHPTGSADLIPVTEQQAIDGHRANFTCRAISTWQDNWANPNQFRASASYDRGAQHDPGYQGA